MLRLRLRIYTLSVETENPAFISSIDVMRNVYIDYITYRQIDM